MKTTIEILVVIYLCVNCFFTGVFYGSDISGQGYSRWKTLVVLLGFCLFATALWALNSIIEAFKKVGAFFQVGFIWDFYVKKQYRNATIKQLYFYNTVVSKSKNPIIRWSVRVVSRANGYTLIPEHEAWVTIASRMGLSDMPYLELRNNKEFLENVRLYMRNNRKGQDSNVEEVEF